MIGADVATLEYYTDLAWEKYCEASERASAFLRGDQLNIFDISHAETREWGGIWQACERELHARRIGSRA